MIVRVRERACGPKAEWGEDNRESVEIGGWLWRVLCHDALGAYLCESIASPKFRSNFFKHELAIVSGKWSDIPEE